MNNFIEYNSEYYVNQNI